MALVPDITAPTPDGYEGDHPLWAGHVLLVMGAVLVAAPVAVLIGEVLSMRGAPVGTDVQRLSIPLMLGWAAVMFLIARTAHPAAAWVGLVGVTVQLTALQGMASSSIIIALESIGFIAFAIALWRVWWIPRILPLNLVAFPVVDAITRSTSGLLELTWFIVLSASCIVVAARVRYAGTTRPAPEPLRITGCSPMRACAPGRTCCTGGGREMLNRQGLTGPFG